MGTSSDHVFQRSYGRRRVRNLDAPEQSCWRRALSPRSFVGKHRRHRRTKRIIGVCASIEGLGDDGQRGGLLSYGT